MTAPAELDPAQLREAIRLGQVQWRKHTLERMATPHVTRTQVLAILEASDVIGNYPDNRPFPSALFLGSAGTRPIHVVAAVDAAVPEAYIITVYEPTLDHFEADGRTRRKP